MTTPADRTDQDQGLLFRREAYAALSGRVPVLLAIAVALLSGGLLGYSWRMCTAEVPRETIVVQVREPTSPLFVLPWLYDQGKGKPALILLGDKAPCAGAEPAKTTAPEAAAPPSKDAEPPIRLP